MNKVSKLTKLLVKASDRAYTIGDDKLLKMLEEAIVLNSNVENQVYNIHTAINDIKRFR